MVASYYISLLILELQKLFHLDVEYSKIVYF